MQNARNSGKRESKYRNRETPPQKKLEEAKDSIRSETKQGMKKILHQLGEASPSHTSQIQTTYFAKFQEMKTITDTNEPGIIFISEIKLDPSFELKQRT